MQEVGLNMLLRKNRCNVQLSKSILAEDAVLYSLVRYNMKEGLDVESSSGEFHFNSIRDFADFLVKNNIVGVLLLDIHGKGSSEFEMSDMPMDIRFYYMAATVIVYDDASSRITVAKKKDGPTVYVKPDPFGRTVVPSNPENPMTGLVP